MIKDIIIFTSAKKKWYQLCNVSYCQESWTTEMKMIIGMFDTPVTFRICDKHAQVCQGKEIIDNIIK